MKRQEKYPDTKWFHFYNANPKNIYGCDCVVRAISTGLGETWTYTVRQLTEVGIECGRVLNDPITYKKYLKLRGCEMQKQPKKQWDGTKYTGKEFCEYLRSRNIRRAVAHIGGHHVVAIVDFKICDIWDSSDGCVGNWWITEKEA